MRESLTFRDFRILAVAAAAAPALEHCAQFETTMDTTVAAVQSTLQDSQDGRTDFCEKPIDAEISSFPTYRIRVKTAKVHTTPDEKSPSHFVLDYGKDVPVVEKRESGGSVWYRFVVQNQSYWVRQESRETPSYEEKETFRGQKIIIDRCNRTLTLYKGDGKTWVKQREHRVGLTGIPYNGGAPKRERGDGRHPVGRYFITGKNPASHFGRDPDNSRLPLASLHLSYPNAQDAWHGLLAGTVTLDEFKTIREQHATRRPTLGNTSLGDDIFIHGGNPKGAVRDWTAGCFSLEDDAMKSLAEKVGVGTMVEIW